MKKILFLLMLVAGPVFGGTIPITGTLRLPNGNAFNGNLRFTLSYSAGTDTCSNNIVVAQQMTFRVQNGTLPSNARITGNDCIAPANTIYTVEYLTPSGTKTAQNNFYVSGTQFNLSTAVPTPITTSNISFDLTPFLPVGTTVDCSTKAGADIGAKLQTCHDALPATGGIMDARSITGVHAWSTQLNLNKSNVQLLLGAATFTLNGSGGITISNNAVGIIGLGQRATVFQYGKFTPGTVITVHCGSLTCAQNYIRSLTFDALGDNAGAKIAMDVIDAEQMDISNVAISNWHDTGNGSIGLQIHGRQTFDVHDIVNFSDKPFHIMQDPNVSSLSLDHAHFYNIYACDCVASVPVSVNPIWTIDSGVILTDNMWDGYQSWVGGSYGLYYLSSGEATTGYHNSIQNCRTEQSTNAAGAAIFFSPGNGSTFTTSVINCRSSANVNWTGFYFRNLSSLRFVGNQYANAGVALDVNSSVYFSAEDNMFNRGNGATVSVAGSHPTKWCGNDEIGQFTVNPQCGIGVAQPNGVLVIPNAASLAGRNAAGSSDIPLISLDDTNTTQVSPNGGATVVGGLSGTLQIGQSLPTSSKVTIPNGLCYGGENAAGSNSVCLATINAADKPVFDGSAAGALFGGTLDAPGGFKVNGVAGYSGTINVRRADDTGSCVITVAGGIITGTNCP